MQATRLQPMLGAAAAPPRRDAQAGRLVSGKACASSTRVDCMYVIMFYENVKIMRTDGH